MQASRLSDSRHQKIPSIAQLQANFIAKGLLPEHCCPERQRILSKNHAGRVFIKIINSLFQHESAKKRAPVKFSDTSMPSPDRRLNLQPAPVP